MKGKGINGTQTLIAIPGVAALAAGGWCLKMWLAAQSHDRQIALEARKNELETGRYRIVRDLARQNPRTTAKAVVDEK